jgi:hypothetical protein
MWSDLVAHQESIGMLRAMARMATPTGGCAGAAPPPVAAGFAT